MTTVDEFICQVQAVREMCEHMNFRSTARIARLTNSEGKVTGYNTDIKVCCADCGHPFTWVGVPFGYSPNHPALSADGQELRAPIQPSNYDLERALHPNN